MKKQSSVRFVHSLSFKLYIGFVACVALLLLVALLFNSVAFDSGYRNQKQQLLTQAYIAIDEAADNVQQLSALLDGRPSEPAVLLWNEHRILCRDPQIPLPTENNPFLTLLPLDLPNGTYAIYDRPLHGQGHDDSLSLYGKTRSGLSVILQVSLADATLLRRTINRVWLWSVGFALLLAVGVLFWLRHSFTRPLSRLSAMAHRMTQQQFHERCPENGKDEFSTLGSDLNDLAETMENALAELKTANARMILENEHKERQHDSRRTFISNVSHELKTPIALIQTYAEGLKEQVAGSEEERAFYCEVISDEAGRLSQMISRMTMLMQLESGKEELQIDLFSIKALCGRLLERYEPLFAQQQVPLPTLPDDDGFVWGDATLIEHVLTNYVTNALHHVDGGGEIRIGWTPIDGQLRVFVFNSGSHIPEEELPRIWESFYKIDKARTRAYGGSGIGLSVVAAIMRVHRMPYDVRNTDNGVEFSFALPLQ